FGVALTEAIAIPDLDVVVATDNRHVAFETRVLAEVGLDRYAALGVGYDALGAGEEAARGLSLTGAAFARRGELLGDTVELFQRVPRQTTVQRPRHDRTPLELLTKPGREDHPSLGVEGVLVLPQKHVPPTSSVFWGCWLRSHPCPPLRPTLCHNPPL